MKHYRLGKKPARTQAKRLWLGDYINRSIVKVDSAPNRDFGALGNTLNSEVWTNVLGNDKFGDCFWAASFRALMAKAATEGRLPAMTWRQAAASVLTAYSMQTGFNLYLPETDQGTDALAGMNFLQNRGFYLPDGTIHKIGSYVWVDPKDFEELIIAHNLFDGLYIGLEFPGSWEDAPVWDVVTDAIEGGHEVIGESDVAISPEGIQINTWGTTRIITMAALANYADEIAVSIGPEMFGSTGLSIAGFDAEQLANDAAAVGNPVNG